MDKIKITHKIAGSFSLLTIMIIGLSIFSYVGIVSIKENFGMYRETARQSLLIAHLVEDVEEGRMGLLKFRLGNEAAADSVFQKFDDIKANHDVIDELVTDDTRREKLFNLEGSATQYEAAFENVLALQQERHAIVAKLDALGPSTRQTLTSVMETAFRDKDAVAAYKAGLVQQHFMLARYFGKNFLLDNKQADFDRASNEIASAQKLVTELLSELQNPTRRQQTQLIGDNMRAYEENLRAVGEVITKRNAFYREADQIGPAMTKAYNEIFTEIRAQQDTLGPAAVAQMDENLRVTVIVAALIVLTSIGLSIVIARFLTKNMAMITSQMDRLAGNDKSFEIEGAQRGDEIGLMAKALEIFRANALEVDRLKLEQEEEEKRQAERQADALRKMANDFDARVGEVIQSVSEASTNMQSMSSMMATAINQTTEQSGSVAAAAQEASTNVKTVAVSAESLTESITEISKSVADTANTSRECASAAEASQNDLTELQSAVDEIVTVIQSINDVAEQTNLLALNATIEAARAGDAGKGFAVVANEVKSLANQTHKMTDEISNKVSHVKKTSEDTVVAISNILQQIRNVDEKTASIAVAIEEQNATTAEISRNVQEAANGTDDVSENISGIQRVANENSESVQKLKDASNFLSDQSTTLKTAVESFLNEIHSGAK